MDPTSFAASLITLLGAAGATTEFVYNFILDIRDVPDEIHSQAIKLQCLHQSISGLIGLYKHSTLGSELQLDSYLEDHLKRFLAEIDHLKFKLKRSSTQLDVCRNQRLWERLTWLAKDRKLRKFYSSLDNWMQIFSTAVITTNLRLLIQVREQTSPARISAQVASPEQHYILNTISLGAQIIPEINRDRQVIEMTHSLKNNQILPTALAAYLSQQIDHVGFRVHCWYTIKSKVVSMDLRAGPATLRSWSADGKAVRKVTAGKNGMHLATTIRTQVLFSRRIIFAISYAFERSKMSLKWDLAAYRMLPTIHPAYIACQRGNWDMLEIQLENKRVGINDTTAYGDSLLHVAAQHGHFKIVSRLLQEGAKVDAENDFGETPLQVTVKQDCAYEVASRLITSGADLTHQDITGRTALHVFFNTCARAIIEYHQKDIDTTAQDAHGKSIAHYISWSKSSSSTDLTRCSTQIPASFLSAVDDQGCTPLHLACQRGNLDIIKFLLSQKDEALARPDWKGRTLLHYATESGRCTEVIELLVVQEGFDVHTRDERGRSVLHHACACGRVQAVGTLLTLGAASDLSAVDADARTPFEVAAWCSRREVVEFLRSRSCGDVRSSEELPREQDSVLGSGVKSNQWVSVRLFWILSFVFACVALSWGQVNRWSLCTRRKVW